MSASITRKKQCVTCNKSGGIMICDGCQQSFCGKHSVDHRQELTNQLDGIMQEHDLIQQELSRVSIDNSLLKQINKWERESITKIQVAAEAARADLQQTLEQSKKHISKMCRDIAINLRSSREADDFSENDLDRWMEQLNELKQEITSPSSIQLVADEQSKVSLITIHSNSFINNKPRKNKQISIFKTLTAYTVQERFSPVSSNDVRIEDDGMVARHIDQNWNYVNIIGERLYSQGRKMVRFKVQFEQDLYNTFLGCISSRAQNEDMSYCSPMSAGWFGHHQIFHHAQNKDDDFNIHQFRTNDIFSIIFDCNREQIELYHERTRKTYKLKIDTEKAPLPWNLLVVLCQPNDCIRILPND